MFPLLEVPQSLKVQLENYRPLFCRSEGFEHVCRYVSGLLLSPNKTLQGIYDCQVYQENPSSRRAMHQAVFEANWKSASLMSHHRALIAREHRGKGKEVISLDWTLAHHERGPAIYAVKKRYDYVKKRQSLYQNVVTALIANRQRFDGIEVQVQAPKYSEEEVEYLTMTAQESYEQMEAVQARLVDLLTHLKNRKSYIKLTEWAVLIVEEIEKEGNFPQAHYAFDNGVLNLKLAQSIESSGKHWVSEIECNRNVMFQGQWLRADAIDANLREKHPESYRRVEVKCRNGESKVFWVFTKGVRLKRYGKKRLVLVHEKEDLSDAARFLLSSATHWEGTRIVETWSYRWTCEIFHEFSKQLCGLESSQVRNEEAVKRHFRLSCVSQSLLQSVAASGQRREKYEFADEKATIGQRLRTLGREALLSLLKLSERLWIDGKTSHDILEVLMPT